MRSDVILLGGGFRLDDPVLQDDLTEVKALGPDRPPGCCSACSFGRRKKRAVSRLEE